MARLASVLSFARSQQPPTLLKENDGRGGRRKTTTLRQAATLIAVLVLVVLLSYIIFRGRSPPLVTTTSIGIDARPGATTDGKSDNGNGGSNHILHHNGLHQVDNLSGSTREEPAHAAAGHEQQQRRPPLRGLDKEASLLQDILHGRIHLMDIKIKNRRLLGQGGGLTGVFCRLEFDLHKHDPSATPMFHNLISKSPDCTKPRSIDFNKVVHAARKFDQESNSMHVLNLTAVVFHMSRCGSTLVSNLLVAANPTEHRVYSESNPPAVALLDICGSNDGRHCNLQTASRILSDVVYLMSRSNDAREQRVFYKFQSITTTALQIFQMTFPDTPWLFVYRDPVQVMMSQLKNGASNANCVRSKFHPPARALEILDKHKTSVQSISSEAYCAVHLASITESAVDALNDRAIPINYQELPHAFYNIVQHDILGHGLSQADLDRMEATAKIYSKGKNKTPQEFEGDSQRKEAQASEAVKDAAQLYLSESYQALEAATAQRKVGRATSIVE